MVSLSTVATGDLIVSSHINQFTEALNGQASVPISISGVNDAANYGLTVRNADATNARTFRAQDSSATTRFDIAGTSTAYVRADPDGSGLSVVATIGHPQTLSSKTLSGAAVSTATPGVLIARLDSTTLASSAASISLSVTSSAYKHLEIRLQGRGDVAANLVLVDMQFNNDTTSNYFRVNIQSTGTVVSAAEQAISTMTQIGHLAGANAGAGLAGQITAQVNNYASSIFQKTMVAQSYAQGSSVAGIAVLRLSAGGWASTAPITSILLYPDAGAFSSGTVASLYGYP